MNGIYLIIGGNMGNRNKNIIGCRKLITKKIGLLQLSSSIYETDAWGKVDEPAYLNQVLYIRTNKSANDTLELCLDIEKAMGRVRNEKWEARVIDIDILFFNDEIIHLPHLKIPHPHLQNRKFVLIPLNEIAPNFVHPVLQKTINKLLNLCNDKLDVRQFI